MTGMIDETACG